MAIDKSTQTISNVVGLDLTTDETGTLCLVVSTKITEMNCTSMNKSNSFIPYRERIKQKYQENVSYPLREVTTEELLKLRLSEIPGIVYKKEDKLYYSEIPGTISLNNKNGYFVTHACGNFCSMVCNGCPRTSALSVSFQQRMGKDFPHAVLFSWRIEKYDFIHEGLETFNMYDSDEFIVLKCENYSSKFLVIS